MERVFLDNAERTIAELIPLIFLGGGSLGSWQSLPWYVLLSGMLGFAVVASMAYMIPHIGAAPAVVLIVAGQLFIGSLLDHFGLFGLSSKPLDLQRVGGLLMVAAGVWVTVSA